MGPGRPEGSMPVTRTKTASRTDSARRVGKAGGATRRADGCPLASVVVRAHLTQRSVTALVNGYLTTGLPGGGLRYGASSLPGACGDDRGAECGGDPLDLQCGLPAATRSQHHAAKSSCGIATFGIPGTSQSPSPELDSYWIKPPRLLASGANSRNHSSAASAPGARRDNSPAAFPRETRDSSSTAASGPATPASPSDDAPDVSATHCSYTRRHCWHAPSAGARAPPVGTTPAKPRLASDRPPSAP